ncbi:hypothetical protein I4F81_009870 [Pyropia yezoensis]|uniref:Uncharacterized protein n=1 Tax=Pyropia yezoensis TaxID=2788 RepID=A0ACC3CC28_PYRYE|nr:hypothetical protein I4F81_009870 [Neopyropia yezoensis]
MSYNILAQSYVSPRYFPSSTPTALRVRPRTARLLAELSSAYGRLDVVALQEADRWAEVFGPALAGAGLGLAYKPRTEGRKPKSDGCGLAYNPARFTPIDARAVEFNDLDPILPQSAGMALLTGGAVPLGHPEVVAARLTPAEVAILEAAPLMRFESAYPMGSGVPGGQGGSPPLTTLTDHFSGMLDYILTSVDDDLAATAAPTTAALEDASPAAVCDADTAPAAAAATVATRHSALVVERTLELPTAEALAAAGVTGLPNEQFASDHLALVADLRWRE